MSSSSRSFGISLVKSKKQIAQFSVTQPVITHICGPGTEGTWGRETGLSFLPPLLLVHPFTPEHLCAGLVVELGAFAEEPSIYFQASCVLH